METFGMFANVKLIVDGSVKKFRKADGMVGTLKIGQKCIVQIEFKPDDPCRADYWAFRKPWINSRQIIQPVENIAGKRRRSGSVYEFKTSVKDVHPDNKGNIIGPVTWPQENHIFILRTTSWKGNFTLWQVSLVSQAGNFFVRTQRMMSAECYLDRKTGKLFCPDISESDPRQSILLDFLDKTVFPNHSALATRNYFQRFKKHPILPSTFVGPGHGIVKFFNPATGIGCAACNLDDKTGKEELVDVRLVWDRMPIDPDASEYASPHFRYLETGQEIKIPTFDVPDRNHRGIIYNKTSFAIEGYGSYTIIFDARREQDEWLLKSGCKASAADVADSALSEEELAEMNRLVSLANVRDSESLNFSK